jgi:hypothetical protein
MHPSTVGPERLITAHFGRTHDLYSTFETPGITYPSDRERHPTGTTASARRVRPKHDASSATQARPLAFTRPSPEHPSPRGRPSSPRPREHGHITHHDPSPFVTSS